MYSTRNNFLKKIVLLQRKRSEEMDIDETDFYSEGKNLLDVDKDGNARFVDAGRILESPKFRFCSCIISLNNFF